MKTLIYAFLLVIVAATIHNEEYKEKVKPKYDSKQQIVSACEQIIAK